MKYYMKQKVFSWGDRFTICDETGRAVFTVKGEVFSWGKKLRMYDDFDTEKAFIYQKVWSFRPRYFINVGGIDTAEVVKEWSFKPRYSITPQGWEITGNFWAHEYEFRSNFGVIASVSKEWFTWGDSYEIDISNETDTVTVLSAVLIIDAVTASESAAASSSTHG